MKIITNLWIFAANGYFYMHFVILTTRLNWIHINILIEELIIEASGKGQAKIYFPETLVLYKR